LLWRSSGTASEFFEVTICASMPGPGRAPSFGGAVVGAVVTFSSASRNA
jgi:hypothetical protein